MDTFQRGQIWLVNFEPSFGHEYKKVRPALIIQSNKHIGSSNLLTIIPISSQVSKQSGLDILLKKDAQNRLLYDSLNELPRSKLTGYLRHSLFNTTQQAAGN